jgi:polygalacturonase
MTRISFLLLAALAPTFAAPTGTVFNVLDYGAKPDASARSTAAFRTAIQAAKVAGGGTVYVPAGTYLSGPIELVSNLTLYIDAGATVRFPADRSELTYGKGRLEGVEGITPDPLIGGRDLENITITGHGTLAADNDEWVKLMDHPDARAVWQRIWKELELKRPVPEADYQKATPFLRPSFIRPMNSKNVLIENIHIVGSPMWVMHILYCENVEIRNVTVHSFPGRNTDGIDIDSSRDVRISNLWLDTGDDSICIKSGRDMDGRRVNRPTENLAITNCTIHHGHGAVVIGSETSGSIRNIVASNIVAQNCQRGARIKSTRGRGAVVENIRFDNFVVEDADVGIEVTSYYTSAPAEPVSERTPIFRNISLNGFTVNRARETVNIEGLPEMRISGLRLTDVVAAGGRGLRAHNTSGMELRNVQVNPDKGPAFLIRDSNELELDGVTTRKPNAQAPVVRLDKCTGTIMRGSRAWPGTGTFLSVAPGALKSVLLESNFLAAAAKATEEAVLDLWKPAARSTEE